MRARFWLIIAIAVLAVGLAGCSAGRVARGSVNTPVPSKTLRPTFTATVPKPTLTPTPVPASPTTVPPTATAVPASPTAEPSSTPEPAAFTVTSTSLNVRGGPGTNFAVLGRLSSGQSFPVTGKNADSSWWQFDYNGKQGWVIGTNVAIRGGDAVQVAQNIPSAPTAAPRPTARPVVPAAPRPTAPPAAPPPAAYRFGLTGKSSLRPNTNPYITVWCLVLNRANNGLIAGTLRVTRGGATVKEVSFQGGSDAAHGDPGIDRSEFLYNPGCKAELPAGDGVYVAYLVDGGQQASDAFSFTVSGESNRTAIVEWKEK